MGNCCASRRGMGSQMSFLGFDLKGQNHPRILARDTYFTEDEVYALFELFRSVSTSIVADGLIHREEFSLALFKTHKTNLFINQVFDLFDEEQNGAIDFGEFVRSMSVFHPRCPIQEKAAFAFRIYDLDDTGTISKEEIRILLKALLKDNQNLHIPDAAIDEIVERTFKEVDIDSNGTINLEEFKVLVNKNPSVISYMTLPILKELTTKFPSFIFNKRV